jgi:hypothetical protein
MTLKRHYDAQQYQRLAEGRLPQDQDDRWFVWVDDDHVVHVHRSWTGFEIYEVHLAASAGGYEIQGVSVNAEPDQHQPNPGLDEAILGPLLDGLAGV